MDKKIKVLLLVLFASANIALAQSLQPKINDPNIIFWIDLRDHFSLEDEISVKIDNHIVLDKVRRKSDQILGLTGDEFIGYASDGKYYFEKYLWEIAEGKVMLDSLPTKINLLVTVNDTSEDFTINLSEGKFIVIWWDGKISITQLKEYGRAE